MAQTATEKKEVTFTKAFSTFSASNIEKAKEFYGKTLGLKIADEEEGLGNSVRRRRQRFYLSEG